MDLLTRIKKADETVHRATVRRNQLLIEARKAGFDLKTLGEALGVHPTTVAYRAPLKKGKNGSP